MLNDEGRMPKCAGDIMYEIHANEQYFFEDSTVDALADLLEQFERPCVLCAPRVGEELEERGVEVAALDIDERFNFLSGFRHWDLYRPEPLETQFEIIFCDPPFFNVSLSRLFTAIRLLAKFDYRQRLIVSYLKRRQGAILGTFSRFNLQPTGWSPTYQTVKKCEKNKIEFFANFDVKAE